MNPLSFSVNTLKPLRFMWTVDRRRRSHRGGVREGFRTPLASPCWVRRLAGCYMTYISCQLMLFLSGHLLGSWLEWQTSADSVLLQSTCTLHKWQSLACYSGYRLLNTECWRALSLSCYIQFTWNPGWSVSPNALKEKKLLQWRLVWSYWIPTRFNNILAGSDRIPMT